MSNSPRNREQDVLVSQTPTQLNPAAAKATDFKIGTATPVYGQHGENKREYACAPERGEQRE